MTFQSMSKNTVVFPRYIWYGIHITLYGIKQTIKPVSGDKLMNNQKQTIKCTVVWSIIYFGTYDNYHMMLYL